METKKKTTTLYFVTIIGIDLRVEVKDKVPEKKRRRLKRLEKRKRFAIFAEQKQNQAT